MRREELEGTGARAPEAGFEMDGAGALACPRVSHQCVFEQTRELLAFAPLPQAFKYITCAEEVTLNLVVRAAEDGSLSAAEMVALERSFTSRSEKDKRNECVKAKRYTCLYKYK